MLFDTDLFLGITIAVLAFVLIIHSVFKSSKIRVLFKVLAVPLFLLLCLVLCIITVESRRKYIPSYLIAEITAPFSSIQSNQSYNRSNVTTQTPSTTQLPAAPTSAPATPPVSQQSGATLGETNALKKAKSYLSIMPYSREGLRKQLMFDRFSESEANYGVANCGANWNEQASKKAESYMRLMPMSRDQLYDQLIYDGFTDMQALIGVGAVGY